jgi:hypothetical protein
VDVTYEFEAVGNTLIGTVSTKLGGGPFSGGKIDGNGRTHESPLHLQKISRQFVVGNRQLKIGKGLLGCEKLMRESLGF